MDTRFWWAIKEKHHVGWQFYTSAETHGRLFQKEYVFCGPYSSLEEAKKEVRKNSRGL
jgi:hypothetical protein